MQNNPFDGSTFQNLDDETQMVFMRAHTQYQVMMMSLQALAEAKECEEWQPAFPVSLAYK
jgi:hypothetical protein